MTPFPPFTVPTSGFSGLLPYGQSPHSINEGGNLQVLHVTLHRKEGPHIGPEFHMATFLLGHGHGRQWPLRSEQVYLDDCEALPRRGGQCGQSGDAERYADAMDGVYCYECWAQVE